jgi:hypothetical protein
LALGVDCAAETQQIVTQDDAKNIEECFKAKNEVSGKVVISSTASGRLEFVNHGSLAGGVIAEENPSLEGLFFESGYPPSDFTDGSINDVTLRNLSSFQTLVAPKIGRMSGSLIIEKLPALVTVEMPKLYIVKTLHLKSLPLLKQVKFSPNSFGARSEITVEDVGLNSIDPILNIGSGQNISINGIPNVDNATLSIWRGNHVNIHGNGHLAMTFNCPFCQGGYNPAHEVSAISLSVSGLSLPSRNDTGNQLIRNLTFGSFSATKNSFEVLPIEFDDLRSLYVQDNPNLSSILFNRPGSAAYGWKEIVITNNTNLRMASAVVKNILEENTIFKWPENTVNTMVFDGQFDNAFL